MNKTMIMIIALVSAAKYSYPQPYLNKFIGNNNYYDAITEKIRLDDLYTHFIEAGIVNRNDELPIIKVNGFDKLEVEPPIVGGEIPYSASDLLALGAGVPEYTIDGQILTAEDTLKKKYSTILKASIENRKEVMAGDIFLTGKTIGPHGEEIDMGLEKEKSLTLTGKNVTDEISSLISNYYIKHAIAPTIDVGINIFNKIKSEALNAKQNVNKVVIHGNPADPSNMYLTVNDIKIGLLSRHKKIDPANKIVLYNPLVMGLAFAGLTYGDIKTNETKVVKARLLANETRVTEQNGSKGLWAKSAPLPLVINIKQFERYNVTL
ncbi:MAG: hypothetical protein MJH09_06450 [Cetobacterium sp.]|nr:hypothetical protein [Cetobacterium sp.]